MGVGWKVCVGVVATDDEERVSVQVQYRMRLASESCKQAQKRRQRRGVFEGGQQMLERWNLTALQVQGGGG
jgi:hypothetical protein